MRGSRLNFEEIKNEKLNTKKTKIQINKLYQ